MRKDSSKHNEYMKTYSKELYKFLKDNNICVRCCKELAFPGRTMCPECLDKNREAESTRSEKSKEQRKQFMREKRKMCIEQGICRECLKRKATVRKKCLECYVKEVKRNKRNNTKVPRSIRKELGLCYFCAEPVEVGFRTCKKHHAIAANNLKNWDRENSNHYWRKVQSAEIKRVQYYVKKYNAI